MVTGIGKDSPVKSRSYVVDKRVFDRLRFNVMAIKDAKNAQQ